VKDNDPLMTSESRRSLVSSTSLRRALASNVSNQLTKLVDLFGVAIVFVGE
jgi:hypothetical protein